MPPLGDRWCSVASATVSISSVIPSVRICKILIPDRKTTDILTLTHTSTMTHLSATSNISTKSGPNELKLCICAIVYILMTMAVFFWCKVARKLKFWKWPLSRTSHIWENFQCLFSTTCHAEFEFQPFLDRDVLWLIERWVVVDVWVSVSIHSKKWYRWFIIL